MQIICNGEATELAPGTRLVAVVRQFGLESQTIVVECDGRIIGRDEWETYELREGSRLELIRFVGGG